MKMKKFTLVFLMFLPLGILAQEKFQKNTKTSFKVSGNCEMCKVRIEKASLSVKGVKMATWDIPSNIISVIYNPNKSPVEDIHKAIAGAGHDTSIEKAPESVYVNLPACCLYVREKIE
jgi:copper chaperone CopZ